jgi:hypothetical protein
VPRRPATSDPAFGSDSFLDVTANLVGVLIILIVVVGVRVAQAPPGTFLAATNAELDRRLVHARSEIDQLERSRGELAAELAGARQRVAAKSCTLVQLESERQRSAETADRSTTDLEVLYAELRRQSNELAQARARLVSFADELEQLNAGAAPPRELSLRSPISRPVDSNEIHFELRGGRVTFVNLDGLMNRIRGKTNELEKELRKTGWATAEVGPVGAFRLRFTMAREDRPLAESLLYGRGYRLVQWQVQPAAGLRGESLQQALQPGSQLARVLSQHSPDRFAVTLWTAADSFAAFRQLRDYLSDRGYPVAAWPLQPGDSIRGGINGSSSFAQ